MITLQKQQFLHKPDEGQYGDCHRTAIAMVLGLNRDEVPHFLHDGQDCEFRSREDAFFRSKNLATIHVPIGGTDVTPEFVLECLSVWAHSAPCILAGMSRTGTNHSVVVYRGQMFDPSINDSGIIGPCDDGFYWLTSIVTLPSAAPP